jgi:hypothetical protein
MTAEFQPANWYGLKDRACRDGFALSAPGYLILLVHPWSISRRNDAELPSAAFQRVCIPRLCDTQVGGHQQKPMECLDAAKLLGLL